MTNGRVGASITRALAYLQSCQQPDGSFVTYRSKTERPFRTVDQCTTTFLPALVLASLAGVNEAKPMCDKLADWLAKQKSPKGSFNYWALGSPERETRPYPDDLDDTFCTLFALWRHDPNNIDGVVLAQAVRLLIAAEQSVGGPYKTWLAPKSAANWQDVDLVVNCNIANFLQVVAEPLQKLTAMMEKAISIQKFSSAFYPSRYVVWYFLARAYRGERSDELAKIIVGQRKNGHWGTPGQTALALRALQHLGYLDRQDQAVAYLLESQQPDGSWPAEALWLDEVKGRAKYYAGSAELTTAIIAETLDGARQAASTPQTIDAHMPEMYGSVMDYAAEQIKDLDKPLRTHMQARLRSMQAGDTNREIALLPYFFARSAKTLTVHDDVLVRLGAANFFGWLAYTIYDDFLDDEGDTNQLAVANVALRRSLGCFRQALPDNTNYLRFVEQAFDRIDTANAWELEHCRFRVDDKSIWLDALPRYGSPVRLSERSYGHVLTPIGVLVSAHTRLDSSKVMLLREGLTRYLTARQLNDDLHDWKDDVRKGHISYVVASVLKSLALAPGKNEFVDLLPKMEHKFWHYDLEKICNTTLRQIAEAHKAFEQTKLLKKDGPLFALLDSLDASMHRTLKERQKAIAFLEAYKR